jgi:hypothetical protein
MGRIEAMELLKVELGRCFQFNLNWTEPDNVEIILTPCGPTRKEMSKIWSRKAKCFIRKDEEDEKS